MGKFDALKLLKNAYNYVPKGGKLEKVNKTITGALYRAGGKGKAGEKAIRFARNAKGGLGAAAALGGMFVDDGPEADETTQRAMNQLRYGADMTDEQLAEAQAEGRTFKDTGIFGEGGLSEEEAMAYIEQNADQRGTAEKIGGGVLGALQWVPGLGQLVGGIGGMEYDRRLGKARNLNLENIVGKLKADANEGKIRKNMEGTMGKFMTEGLLDKDFGRGKVRTQGGIRPADDPEQAAALKEYEAIKERDGVHAALAHPSAAKAGRQVYLDVQEAAGGDKNTAEALLSGVGGQSGVGLTDQETMQKYYGDPENNALANRATAAEATISTQTKEAAAQQAAAEQVFADEAARIRKTGTMALKPAQNAEQVRQNREAIVASTGYHGESPQAEMQRAYFEDRRMPTARSQSLMLEQAADIAYEKKHGFGRFSPQAYALSLDNHAKAMAQAQQQYRDRRAMLAEQEYAKHIVKPGDPDYKLGPKVTASTPDEMAQADRDSAASMGDGSVPSPQATLPAQVNQSANTPGIPSNIAPPSPNPGLVPPTVPPANVMKPTPYGVGTATPGFPKLPDIGAPVRNAVDRALTQQSSRPGNVMAPTPNGLRGPTPGMPQLPDIGAPVRNAVDNALTQRSSRPGNVMAPTPYGLGTATPGVPQAPDIGAPVRNAVQGDLTQQSSPPGVAPKKPMDQAEIAKMLAEQKRKEIEARNRANPQSSPMTRPDAMRRFR